MSVILDTRDTLTARRESTLSAILDGTITPAKLREALQDTRVRDVVLWEWQAGQLPTEALSGMLKRTLSTRPKRKAAHAPALTILGLIAWNHSPSLALELANSALAIDPTYSLAGLASYALAVGMPYSDWVGTFEGLTREACLHGESA